MLLPAAQVLAPLAWADAVRVASTRLWPAQEYTRDHRRVDGAARVHGAGAAQARALRARPRGHRRVERARSNCRRACSRSTRTSQSIRVGKRPAGGTRIVLDAEDRGQAGRLRADAGRRIRPSPRARPLSGRAARSADGVARERGAEGQEDRAAARRPLRRSACPSRRAAPKAAERKITIAIDPGHGGEDPGAVGRRGTYEKNVMLAIARKLKARIDGDRNMRAMLTRDDDYFVPLHERVQKARRVQADLFVSIHADAFTRAGGARVVGVRVVGVRCDERCRALARAAREPRRPDRRRRPRPPRPDARAHAARSFADGADQRQPEGRPPRARRHRRRTTPCTRTRSSRRASPC